MNEEVTSWLKSLTEKQRKLLAIVTGAARSEGFQAGAAKADRAYLINKITIPLAVFGVPVGMLIQRYLIG